MSSEPEEATRPSRRRWRWLAVAMLVIAFGGGALVLREQRIESRTRAWIAQADRQSIVVDYEKVCVIPGFRDNPVGKMLLGRRQIFAVATRPADVDALLAMPKCPVKLLIGTGVELPEAEEARLRQHFAKDRN